MLGMELRGRCRVVAWLGPRRGALRWRAAGLVLVLLVPAPLLGAAPVQAQSSEVSTAGFDTAGLEAVVLAAFDAAGSETLWAASGSPWGASGTLVGGDVALDGDTRIVRVMVPASDGSTLRLNDGGDLVLRHYFGQSGPGADLTVWVQTAAGAASFAASGVRSAGSNYVNFNVPASERAVLSGIGAGDRFLLALTRPAPNTAAAGAPTITGTARVGETLTAATGGISDAGGLQDAVFAYQWLADDAAIAGATSISYTLVAGDEGRTIKVRVSFSDDGGNPEQLTSAATPAVAAAAPAEPEPPTDPETEAPGTEANARELLWSHTFVAEAQHSTVAATLVGARPTIKDQLDSWNFALPGDAADVFILNVLTGGEGQTFYFTTLESDVAPHGYALVVEVQGRELPISAATIVEGGQGRVVYAWPGEGMDWSAGDVVDIEVYNLPGEPAPSLPRLHRPGRIPGVALAPAEAGGLAVTWEAPPNAAQAEVLEYHVFLKREADDWSDAQRQVTGATGQAQEPAGLSFFGLEAGVEYRARVFARNRVAYGRSADSAPVAAPERDLPPAALSSLSASGTTGVEFDPDERRYVAQVEPGVTEVTIDHRPSEEGATSEVTVVRTDGGLEADTEDADPDAEGHQARLSSDGDTTALFIVTSEDGLRQDGYGLVLRQSAADPEDGAATRSATKTATKSQPAGLSKSLAGTSGRRTRSGSAPPVPVDWTISYGDQTIALAESGFYRTATVPHEVSQVTLAPTEPFDGTLLTLIRPSDADSDSYGHQVNLRASHPGGPPAETVVAVFSIRSGLDFLFSRYFFIKVFRSAPTQTDATLDSLELEGADLFPSFLYDFQEYTASAAHDTATATIKATANQPSATLAWDPLDADAGTDDYQRTLTAGDNLVTITVTAPDGNTTLDYTVTIDRPPPPSTDATLSSLSVSGATISPAFASNVTTYSATVRSHASLVTLELATSDDGASIDVSPADANGEADGWQIPVEVGANTVTITITAEDGTTTGIYTLTVNRNSLEMESAPLGSLTVEGATIFPAFGSGVLAYTAVVGNDQEQVTIAAAAESSTSTVTVDPEDADDGTDDHQVALAEGRNVITVTVTAMNMTTTREYQLTVFRAPAPAVTSGYLQADAGWWDYCGLRVDHTIACNRGFWPVTLYAHVPDGVFERISVHRSHGCGLRADGSQVCWNGRGKVFRRTGLKVGDFHMSSEYGGEICALGENGDLRCRKLLTYSADYAPPDTVIPGPFRAIAQHRFGACAIRLDNKVRCWAYGHTGELIPIDLPNEYRDTRFKFISGGYTRACGIRRSDSAILCWQWRYNPYQFHAENADNHVEYAPPGEYSFVDTSTSRARRCGVRTDGTIDCWFYNGHQSNASNAPGEDIGYESVTLEFESLVCGLRKDKELVCWNGAGTRVDDLPRESPWKGSAQLLDIDLGGATLSPGFGRDVLAYTAPVGSDVAYVTVKPIPTNSLAVHSVYSDTAGAAGDDGVVPLVEGDNEIRIHVVSADRTATNTYTVTVTRAQDGMSGRSLSIEPKMAAEGRTATVKVTVTDGDTYDTDQKVSLTVSGTASESDYSLPDTVTLPAHATSTDARITITDDDVGEPSEVAIVKAAIGEQPLGSASLVIPANDAPVWAVSAEPVEIAEGAASTVTVAIANGVTFAEAQTVALAVSGTASGSDYTLSGTSLTLDAGSSSVSATVTATDDTLEEAGETVVVTATRGGQVLGSATVTIQANDAPVWAVSAEPVEIAEGAASTVTVAIANGVTFAEAQTVALAVSGTASGSDYTLSGTSLTLDAGSSSVSATVTATDDTLEEAGETVVVTATRGGQVLGSATVTIQANDAPVWAVSAEPIEIAEGAASTVTVAIANGVTFAEAQTVALAVSGTASGSDYTLSGTSLTLDAGSSSVSATVTATDDTLEEAGETVVVTATRGGQVLGSATVTIPANDVPPSSDATLSSLALSRVDIGTFSSSTAGYTASVAHGVSSTTVAVNPSDGGASVTIAGAGGSTQGTSHTVPLSVGDNVITVTVTAEDGITTKVYTVTVARAEPEAPWGDRLANRDIELGSGAAPTGLWSDGDTVWVITDPGAGRVRAYSLAGGAELTQRGFTLAGGVGSASALWSDGVTLWVADLNAGRVRAYRLSDGARRADQDLDSAILSSAGNTLPSGLWSDGDTMWVADYSAMRLFAYDLRTKARQQSKEFDLNKAPGEPYNPWGIWSNGTTVWVANWIGGEILAHRLSDGQRQPSLDLSTLPSSTYLPTGIWSHGETLYVADDLDGAIYAYAAPGVGTTP